MPIIPEGWGRVVLILMALAIVVMAACLPEARGLLVAWLLAVACSWRSSEGGRS
jgi:hypothetical protein